MRFYLDFHTIIILNKKFLFLEVSTITINNYKRIIVSVDENNFARKVKLTNNFLKDNPDIYFTNSDKGSVSVCLNKSDYFSKIDND